MTTLTERLRELDIKKPKYLDGSPLDFRFEETSKKDDRGHYISITCNGAELMKFWNPDAKRQAICAYIFACLSYDFTKEKALAQDLHALLVECGGASSSLLHQRREFDQSCGNYEEAYYKLAKYADWQPLKTVFTKLEKAGIV